MPVIALKPKRGYSFTGHAVSNPAAPPPGDRLDGEVDRIDLALAQLIDFVSVSFNSDGTLKPASVGRTQMVPGLFEAIAEDAAAALQPFTEAASQAAGRAGAAAAEAQAAAEHASSQHTLASETVILAEANVDAADVAAQTAAQAVGATAEAAVRADLAATTATEAAARTTAAGEAASAQVALVSSKVKTSLKEAETLAQTAAASAAAAEASARAVAQTAALLRDLIAADTSAGIDAQTRINLLSVASDTQDAASSAAAAAASAAAAANSANHADGVEAVVTDYGLLTQAWAEHMPDVIPPNILAVMDVTGDHWSSRWWANRAAQIVGNQAAFVSTPNSGDVVVVPSNATAIYVNNANTLAALTIWLPLVAGGETRIFQVGFHRPVTALTVLTGTGAVIPDTPTNAYGPGAAQVYRYDSPGWVYWK